MESHYLTDLSQALLIICNLKISDFVSCSWTPLASCLQVYMVQDLPACVLIMCYGYMVSHYRTDLSQALLIICNLKISHFVSCSWTPLASCLQVYMVQDLPACALMCYGYMVSHYLTDLSQALGVLFPISKYPTLFHVAELLWLPVNKRICCKPVCLCINVLRIYGIPLSYWPLSGSLLVICNLKISDFVSCSWTSLASC